MREKIKQKLNEEFNDLFSNLEIQAGVSERERMLDFIIESIKISSDEIKEKLKNHSLMLLSLYGVEEKKIKENPEALNTFLNFILEILTN